MPRPLFGEVRELILRKCRPDKSRAIRSVFETQPFGALERLVTQKLLDAVKSVAKEELESEDWLHELAGLGGRSYEEMRVIVLEFLDTDIFDLSMENCVSFLDPLIESWDIDLGSFAIEIVLKQLVELLPDNPRSWIEVGIRRNALGDREAAREGFLRAVQVAPDLVDPHLFLSWHYATFEPKDPAQAEQHARHAVELEPEESFPYDWLGDALRLQGRLEEAAAAYTTGAELDPMTGMLQQRAHVNSFLGNYAEARADYESAAAAATGNDRGTLLMYRAFVNLYEGDPQAAVGELEAQYQAVDGLGIPDPDGLRVALARQQFAIRLHHRLMPVAERAGERLKQLTRRMADAVGTADLRRDADATAAPVDGYLAAYGGDYGRAEQQAQDYIRFREPERSPTRNWPAHELLGTAALLQDEYEDALAHFDRSSPDSEYVTYQRAPALEALDRTDEARAAYQKVADYYFNSVQNALVRNEVLAKLE